MVEPLSSLKADVVKTLAHPGRIPILELHSEQAGALERSAADT
ncbi:MAG: hypothetical protein WA622_20995 [Mycobacterium sp.]